MKTGALLFAYNTDDTDYLKIAEFSAKNIKRWLNIPTTVVTDVEYKSPVFDKIITNTNTKSSKRYFDDRKSVVEWRNSGRCCAYDLSPYDQTLLLDVDYIVASDQLQTVLDTSYEFICPDSAIEVSGTKGDNPTFGKFNMKMFWATVIMFRKTKQSRIIFELIKMIENNFGHYANLYGFPETLYRNDYALSIALSIVSGHLETKNHSMPWPMINIHPEHDVKKIDTDCFEVTYKKTTRTREKLMRNKIKNQDIHVMGKSSLEKIIETS